MVAKITSKCRQEFDICPGSWRNLAELALVWILPLQSLGFRTYELWKFADWRKWWETFKKHSGFELWFREKKVAWHMTFTQSLYHIQWVWNQKNWNVLARAFSVMSIWSFGSKSQKSTLHKYAIASERLL